MCWSSSNAVLVGLAISDRLLRLWGVVYWCLLLNVNYLLHVGVNKALLHVSISSTLVNVCSLAC